MTPPLTGPLFVTGFPRSGTSGLATGLSQLPGLAAHGAEGHFVYLLHDAVSRIRDRALNPNCIVRDSAAQAAFLGGLADAVDAAYRATAGTAARMWIDKTPDVAQVAALPTIHALFPQAWVFYIYRDPLSAVRSNMATWPAELAGQDLAVARRWRQCQATWRANRDAIPADRRLEIFQPDLRADPAAVVDRIAALMGLDAAAAAPLHAFWTAHRQVNRPTEGRAAQDYDAVRLSPEIADQVLDICSDEMAHWPRLADAARPLTPVPLPADLQDSAGLYPWEGPYPQMALPRFAWVRDTGLTLRLPVAGTPRRLCLTGRSLFAQQIVAEAAGRPLLRQDIAPGPFTLTVDLPPGDGTLQLHSTRADRLSPTDPRRTGWALYGIDLPGGAGR